VDPIAVNLMRSRTGARIAKSDVIRETTRARSPRIQIPRFLCVLLALLIIVSRVLLDTFQLGECCHRAEHESIDVPDASDLAVTEHRA